MNTTPKRSLKRWGCSSLVGLLVLLLLAALWIARDSVPPLRYVPANSTKVVRITDLNGHWPQLESLPCLLGLPKETKEALLKTDMLKFARPDNKIPGTFRQKMAWLAGKELIVATPPVADKEVFFTKVHPLLKVAEWGARASGKAKINLDVTDKWPLRWVITKEKEQKKNDEGELYWTKEERLYWVITGRVFIGSSEKSALLECLNTKEPLQKADEILALRKSLSHKEGLEVFLAPQSKDNSVALGPAVLVFSLREDGDIDIEGKAPIEGKRKDLLKAVKPGNLDLFADVPRNSLVALGMDWTQPLSQGMSLLSQILDEKALDPRNLDPNMLSMAQLLGFNLQDDVLNACQEEMVLALSDVDLNEAVPLPECALFLKSSKSANGADVLGRALRDFVLPMGIIKIPENVKPFIQIEEKEFSGHKAFVMPNAPFGKGFKPCLSSTEDALILSSSQRIIEQVLSPEGQQASLATRPGFEEIMKSPTNFSLFIQAGEIARRVESLQGEMARLGMLRKVKKKEGGKLEIKVISVEEFDREKRPFYQLLGVVDGILFNASVVEDQLVFEGKIHLVAPTASKPAEG